MYKPTNYRKYKKFTKCKHKTRNPKCIHCNLAVLLDKLKYIEKNCICDKPVIKTELGDKRECEINRLAPMNPDLKL